jgi:hypothetical protein
MQTFATNFINNGGLLILLQQSAIPISMIITKYMLKVKYNYWNYIGAVVVMAGIMIVLGPSFATPDKDEPKLFFVWVAVMLVSCVPMTLSSVYKEKALGETEIDVVYLNGWVAVYQLIITLIFAVPCGYANSPPIPPSELLGNLWDGMQCYVGIEVNQTTNMLPPSNMTTMLNGTTTLLATTATTALMGGSNQSSMFTTMMAASNDTSNLGRCGGSPGISSPIAVNTYMAFNILYNVFIILILKYGGSNVLWLAMTLMVPLGNAAFALPFVPGHRTMSGFDGGGLVVIMLGLIIYRFWAPVTKFMPLHWRIVLAKYSFGPPLPKDDEVEEEIDPTGSVKYPLLGSVMSIETFDPIYVVRPERKLIRTQHEIRSAYFARLGIGAPGGPDRVSFFLSPPPPPSPPHSSKTDTLFLFVFSFLCSFEPRRSTQTLNEHRPVVMLQERVSQLPPVLFARSARRVDHNVVGATVTVIDAVELVVAVGIGFVAILVVGKRFGDARNVGQRQRGDVAREGGNRLAAARQQAVADRLRLAAKLAQQKAQRPFAQVALQIDRQRALLVKPLAQKKRHKGWLAALDDADGAVKVATGYHFACAVVDFDVDVAAAVLEQVPRELADRHAALGGGVAERTADRPELGSARLGHVEAQRRLARQLVAGNQQHRLRRHLLAQLLQTARSQALQKQLLEPEAELRRIEHCGPKHQANGTKRQQQRNSAVLLCVCVGAYVYTNTHTRQEFAQLLSPPNSLLVSSRFTFSCVPQFAPSPCAPPPIRGSRRGCSPPGARHVATRC